MSLFHRKGRRRRGVWRPLNQQNFKPTFFTRGEQQQTKRFGQKNKKRVDGSDPSEFTIAAAALSGKQVEHSQHFFFPLLICTRLQVK